MSSRNNRLRQPITLHRRSNAPAFGQVSGIYLRSRPRRRPQSVPEGLVAMLASILRGV